MPFAIQQSVMATSPNDRGVILIGGYTFGGYSKKLVEWNGNSKEWVILDSNLKYGRHDHAIIQVPNDFTC